MTRPFLAKYHVYYEEKKLSSCSLEMKILPLQNVYHVPELNVTPFQVLGNVLLNAKLYLDFHRLWPEATAASFPMRKFKTRHFKKSCCTMCNPSLLQTFRLHFCLCKLEGHTLVFIDEAEPSFV